MGLVVTVMLLWSYVLGRRSSPFVPTYINEHFIWWYTLEHDSEHTGSQLSCFLGFLCMCVWSAKLGSLELKTSGFFGPAHSPQAFSGWPYIPKMTESVLLFIVNLFWWMDFLLRKNTMQSWKYKVAEERVTISRRRLYCFCCLRMHKVQWHWPAVPRGSLQSELPSFKKK